MIFFNDLSSSSSSSDDSLTIRDEWKCSYLEWDDQEWPQSLKMCLAKLRSMYEEVNRDSLIESVVNIEEHFKMREEMRKMEHALRYIKLGYAKMMLVSAKEVFTKLKAEMEKTLLADHPSID
ncbi:hypothetical protein ZWY2020_025484 [Hordeum vulgare]|nr:hypothetical protein ZWY2020_025484 [Hordeum vulgare]